MCVSFGYVDLFCTMDQKTDLGIVHYGVTKTTLEDVFLKLEDNETLDEGKVLFGSDYCCGWETIRQGITHRLKMIRLRVSEHS